MNTTPRSWIVGLFAAILLTAPGGRAVAALQAEPAPSGVTADEYFAIQVVDRQAGRGVPLVELRTTNGIRYCTDSSGLVAFCEPGLMDREVFFFVESPGYEYPKDGFGYQGTRLRTTPGTEAVVKIDRLNLAERLYRVTGQGIYRDSVLLRQPVPLQNPVLNGQVMGQDSVDTCLYRGRLFWLWGDTGRPSYPLGHFATAGAVSDLPGQGGLDPAVGVNLEYFVDKNGFSRPICRLKEPGLVWLDGLLVVKDDRGRERMLARFARLKDLGHVLERGLVVFNDATESFEPLVRSSQNLLPYPNFGHAFPVTAGNCSYWYFALPFPLTVRMRIEAQWNAVIDPNRYEVLTALEAAGPLAVGELRGPSYPTDISNGAGAAPRSTQPKQASQPPDAPRSCRWVRFDALADPDAAARARVTAALQREKKDTRFHDIQTGREITPHGGSVYFNTYRHKWVAVFVQAGGKSSYLGEVWYAEADTPIGPWAYARQVVTHNKYSFYNPKQHPYFDREGGRMIFFEGTYSHTFSGAAETATPRYDYNQIMYRLNLSDPGLVLPAPVYQIGERQEPADEGEKARTTEGPNVSASGLAAFSPSANGVFSPSQLLLADAVAWADKWDQVEAVAFYAVEPNRPADGLVAVYAREIWRGRPALAKTSPVSSLATPVTLAERQGHEAHNVKFRVGAPRNGLATQGRDAGPKRSLSGLGTRALARQDRIVRLTTRSDASTRPLFLARPAVKEPQEGENPCLVLLYEYRHTATGQFLYSTKLEQSNADWERTETPVCRVWKTPPGPLLLDARAHPAPTD
jgi:hypothetical protein